MAEDQEQEKVLEDGGSGYIGGVPGFVHTNGKSYTSTSVAGQRGGNGFARITFIDFAEEETFSKTTRFVYTGKMQTYTVPKKGLYKIEAWGAQGGTPAYRSSSSTGGYGGYSSGYKVLNKGTVLYVGVGSQAPGGYSNAGGYNGGGTGGTDTYHAASGGGGASHVATADGLLPTLSSNISSILLVAGGRWRRLCRSCNI